jgi:RCR-type E3 ubiquitin transferase
MRTSDIKNRMATENMFWHCVPEIIPDLGPKSGKKVNWISASGDQTYLGLDEVLINADILNKMKITADSKAICK